MKAFSSNLDVSNSNNNGSDDLQLDFYSPISKSGYLTPLQRKKLREKRCIDINERREEIDLKNLKKVKKGRITKVKKGNTISVSSKKKQINLKKNGNNVPGVHCVAAKFFTKPTGDSFKEKKFFKSSPSKRLQKASFSMPLVLKKNVLADFDKVIKELYPGPRRSPSNKESGLQENFVACLNENENELAASCESKNDCGPFIVKIVPATPTTCNSSLCRNQTDENVLQSSFPKEVSTFTFDWPDEIFVQRQDRAAGLKDKNILKEPNTCTGNEQTEINQTKVDESGIPVKLYPIFTVRKEQLRKSEDVKRPEKSVPKFAKDSGKGGEQMIIDAGQKEIGPKICHTCAMIYTIGHEEDERLHSDYHNMFLTNLKFLGWKEENVIGEYYDGRVIMVRQNDKSLKLKKVEDILMVANRDLGFSTAGLPSKPDVTYILFISNEKRVAGCVVAELISSACQVLLAEDQAQLKHLDKPKKKIWRIGNWYSSSECVPAVCGINRIWVSKEFRRRKVASRMIDCLRCNFLHGHVIGIQELAFTDPSPDGREFAAAYTGTDHFLVYK